MENQVKSFMSNQMGSRAKGVGDQLLTTAGNLRVIAEQLRTDSLTHGAADLAMVGVTRLEGAGRYLSETDLEAMIRDAEAYSRQRPWTVALGGLVIGLSASRVIKAGAARRALYDTKSSSLPSDDQSDDDTVYASTSTPSRRAKKTRSAAMGGALASG